MFAYIAHASGFGRRDHTHEAGLPKGGSHPVAEFRRKASWRH